VWFANENRHHSNGFGRQQAERAAPAVDDVYGMIWRNYACIQIKGGPSSSTQTVPDRGMRGWRANLEA